MHRFRSGVSAVLLLLSGVLFPVGVVATWLYQPAGLIDLTPATATTT